MKNTSLVLILFRFKTSGIRTKLVAITLLLVLVPLILTSIVTNWLFGAYIEENAINKLEYSSMKIGERFKSISRNLNELTSWLIFNETIQKSLSAVPSYTDHANLDRLLSQYGAFPFDSIMYIDNKFNTYSTASYGTVNLDSEVYQTITDNLQNTYGELIWVWQTDNLFSSSDQDHLFIARYVRHLNINHPPGILIARVNSNIFDSIIVDQDLVQDSLYLIMDHDAKIVFSKKTGLSNDKVVALDQLTIDTISQKTDSNISIISRDSDIILFSEESNSNWKIASIISKSTITHELRKLQLIIAGIISLAVLCTSIIILLYTNRFTRPINQIIQAMHLFQSGDFSVRLNTKTNDEFKKISETFNQMVVEIDDLLKQNQQNQEMIRISELNSLMYQINPHFIYNTLENIYMLSRLSKEKKIGELIYSLSRFLRISLSKGQQSISLQSEFEHVEHYMRIQQMRHENLFMYQLHLPEKLSKVPVIKFILQPIVENCISHGFRNIDSDGQIIISAMHSDNCIKIQITDNGCGMEKSKIYQLNQLNQADNSVFLQEHNNDSQGYGVNNVISRIKLYYGESANVIFGNKQMSDHGTICTIIFPYQTD